RHHARRCGPEDVMSTPERGCRAESGRIRGDQRMTVSGNAGGRSGHVPVRRNRGPGEAGVEKRDAWQAVRAGATDKGTRSVDRIRILVVYTGMSADALDSLPRGQFSCKKTLHAAADEEVFFVPQVHACQYVQVVPGPSAHVSMVTIGAAMSMAISRAFGDICDRGIPGHE
ncbi:MAG: hypothetical protein OXC11_01065, partial [Rhodospirillales bacterium]|nr:hypothetical protein [Rhodospirillales bacterium]